MKKHLVYQTLMQERKLKGTGIRISVLKAYFGEAGSNIATDTVDDRWYGTVVDWKEKKSNDPKLKVLFDGETHATPCPLATLLEAEYEVLFEDGRAPPAFVAKQARPAAGRRAPVAAPPAQRRRIGSELSEDEDEVGSAADAAQEQEGYGHGDDGEFDDEDDEYHEEEDGSDSSDFDESVYDEVNIKGVIWKRLTEDGVKEDSRAGKARFDGYFQKKTGLGDVFHVFMHMLPPEFIDAHLAYTNPNLNASSGTHIDKPMTKGECLLFWG